ncbi:MAG TPA: glycosyltransferase family 2 protein [Solirubrobacteraceae bacterium]|nr:glycosyltransferase family 2 protein [Solirubrobacteraceae bacterium]
MSGPPDPASVSVIVPTFNDVGRIGDALASIVAQTAPPGEIVVCDDASEDATEELVRDFAAQQAGEVPVRYIRRSSRAGVVAARNEGSAAAHGEWIATCDSDDVWAAGKLERQIAFFRDWKGSRRLALLGTHGYNMNDAKKVISPAIMGPTTEEDYDAIMRAGRIFFVIHSSVLYSRADYLAVGGYTTEYGAADDFHFFCRMAERGVVVNLPEPLVYYRKRSGSVQLARFWDQQQGLLRLTENQRRRAAGEAPIGSEEFAAKQASAPAWRRFRRARHVRGMYYYRMGANDMVNGRRVRGGLKLLLASTMDGGRLRAGVRNAIRAPGR